MVSGNQSIKRELSWAEREFLSLLQASAPADVPIESLFQIPHAFWEAIVQATDFYVLEVARPPGHEESSGWRNQWKKWEKHFTWHTGLGALKDHPWNEYHLLVTEGRTSARTIPEQYVHPAGHEVTPALRLSALEFLLDVTEPHKDLEKSINERAGFLNLGLRLAGKRFVPTTSEALHDNIVKPAITLLADPRFEQSEKLFRLATAYVRSGDYADAVTAAWRSAEQALETAESSMEEMANQARAGTRITPAVADLINRLQAMRYPDDPADAGIDLHTAMLAIHVSGALITYVSTRT
ncbi:MAG: hypothetical protein ACT4OM_06100 [Actinomycetota bacterium]